jgi:flavin reductase (DIM6/NTAB) family NADH-FMN oxidoreductase RutF
MERQRGEYRRNRRIRLEPDDPQPGGENGRDEFEFAGLTPTPGTLVAADRVAESPVNFECKLSQCIQLQSAAGEKIDTWLVMGEVVAVHIARHLLNEDGIYQTALAEPVLRAGGPSAYYGVSEDLRFDLTRPDAR